MIVKNKVGRRRFIKAASAAVVAAPYIVPSSVFGATAPSNRLNMVQIGIGNMGTTNMTEFLKREDVQVVAVCDLDRARLLDGKKLVEDTYANRNAVDSYAGCDTIHDFRDAVSRADIDFVSIAVPDHWHAIPAIAAANAGKDIYAEKPLARTIKEGRAICDAVKANNTVWQTGSWQRSVPNFRQACELVCNGRIGDIHTIEVGLPTGTPMNDPTPELPVPDGFDYDFWLGPAPKAPYSDQRCHWNFRWIMDYSGGQLTDWAGHHIDIAHWGMDANYTGPVEVEGRGNFPRNGLWNTATTYKFVCKYKNGVTMTVGSDDVFPMGVKFIGTDGWLYVKRGDIDASNKSLLTSMIGRDETHLYRSDNHWGNFIDCVKSRELTITPPDIAQRSISVGHLGNIAMQLERKIHWNPDTETVLNDPEANRLLVRSMRSPWHI